MRLTSFSQLIPIAILVTVVCHNVTASAANVTYYSKDCELTCSIKCTNQTCDTSNGTCQSCIPGTQTPMCDQACNVTYYSKDCELTCSINCTNQTYDASNGTCQPCIPGTQTPMCDQACNVTYYSKDCELTCSINCTNQTYDASNGTCQPCIPGTQTPMCDQACNVTYYSKDCELTCSINCTNQTYDASNGTCQPCIPGTQTPMCDQACNVTYYSKDCELTCSINCTNQTYDASNGTCQPCIPGTQTPMCDQESNEFFSVGAIVVPVVALTVLVLMIIIFFTLRRRHHKQANPGQAAGNSHGESVTCSRASSKTDPECMTAELTSLPHVNHVTLVEPKSELNQNHTSMEDIQEVIYTKVSNRSDTAIKVQDLNNYMASHTKEFLPKQFASIPAKSTAAVTEGLGPDNQNKNRFSNIIAYNHSRVHLTVNSAKKHDIPSSCFVPASSFKRQKKFIASQGPNKIILKDFVRMLWEQKIEVVVMLTKLVENGKLKCEQYWPDDGQMDIGEITITLTTTQAYPDYTIRRLELSKTAEPVRILFHFHFTTWPDKSVPSNPWALVDIEQRIALITTHNPIVVHCSAGVGRTGTFIALHNVLEEIEATGSMDFFRTVQKLRNDRGFMVQTYRQYEFLHDVTRIALVCKGTTMTKDIEHRIKSLEEMSFSNKTYLENEFNSICELCKEVDDYCKTAENEREEHMNYNSQMAINKMKNRFHDVLSKKYYKPTLKPTCEGMENYINAVFVPGLKKHDHQILTQLPLPETTTDFWGLVTQYKVTLIVAFEKNLMAEYMTIGDYLPEDINASITSSPFNITIKTCYSNLKWKEQNIVVTEDIENNTGVTNVPTVDKEYYLTHISCESTNLNPHDLLALVRQIWSLKSVGEGRILYMCRNGARLSGLVCTLSLLLERMNNDQYVSVPIVVGTVKAIRPQVISTLDQYKLLYQVLQLFLETKNVYSNLQLTYM